MSKERRRELTAEYKERKARPGIFAIRCAPAGLVWVGSAQELANRQNRFWFALRLAQHRNAAMQAAWTAHGEESFVYEELEAIDGEDLSGWLLTQTLKDRLEYWRHGLNAADA